MVYLQACFTVSTEIPSVASIRLQKLNEKVENKLEKREDSIPVIEIRGEGKPMSASQISFKNQKVTKTWAPGQCPRKARRLDFVTFHYKGFSEAVWRFIPNDEHWLRFDIEAIKIEPWTIEGQFEWMDLNNDSKLTEDELSRFDYKMLKEFGKAWPNADIDTVTASKYYIKYFDANNDGIINIYEFKYIFKRDMSIMKSKRKNKEKIEGRKRDPGLQWILDYNNDGIVTVQEIDNADKIFEVNPAILPGEKIKEEL
uniref:peptidylprolyl isomerase n=1 Tax=Meloidogyne javanica TaxID=6303 RepID=A0A915LHZ0_MELJA